MRAKAAVLTRATFGATSGVVGGVGVSDERSVGAVGSGGTRESVWDGEPNEILLNAQSIDGL